MGRSSFYNNFGKDGNKISSSRKDLLGGSYTHYDSKGRKVGSSRENLFGGGYTHYDTRGRKVGSSSRQALGSGYNNYDSRGRKTGSTNRQLFGNGYNHYDAKGNKIGSSAEGCYIATCVYGSYDCREVLVLRKFRDVILKRSFAGRMFIRVYYAISPRLVCWFGEAEWFRKTWRRILDKLISRLE